MSIASIPDPQDAAPANDAAAIPIRVLDTSLRDGEQSPGCSLNAAQKLRFAHTLAELGVDIIEAGFASSSVEDNDGIAAIAASLRGSGVGVASLSRCVPSDIEAAARALAGAERPTIHIFVSTSPLHREHKLRMSTAQVLDVAAEGIRLARRHVDQVQFSAEDAVRTEPEFLAQVLGVALQAGATTLNVPDTVGYTTPDEIRALFRYLRQQVPGAEHALFSAHCHNDLGLAVANTLAAIEGGARQVECTINGIGERAGNCALEELVMALRTRGAYYRADTRVHSEKLLATSQLLSRLTGMQVQRNKAIVGANAFAHEAGIHQHGMLRHPGTYEIMRPESVGWSHSQMVLGRHSGRAALADRLQTLGLTLDAGVELDSVFAAFKTLAAKKREVFDADLVALLRGAGHETQGWQLKTFHISTGAGDGQKPAAAVELIDHAGAAHVARARGDGPVHAVFEALAGATGIALKVHSYQVRSVSSGDDAQGEASLIASVDGEEFTATGVSTDILEASVHAWLDIANRLYRRQRAGVPVASAVAPAIDAAAA